MEQSYKQIENVGNVEPPFDEAEQNGVAKLNESMRHVDWFTLAKQCMIFSRLLTDRRGK